MLHRVTAPVLGYSGAVGGVTFADGVAAVDDETHAAELAYCRNAGYTIDPAEPDPAEPDPAGPPKKSASTDVWREYAIAHGMPVDEANAKSRDELVAHFTKENPS